MTTKTSKNGGSSASGTTENMIDGINAAVKTWGPAGEYMLDAMQRTILFWDVLRQRSDQYYDAEGEGGAACAELRRRTGAGRPDLRPAGQLPAGADQADRKA